MSRRLTGAILRRRFCVAPRGSAGIPPLPVAGYNGAVSQGPRHQNKFGADGKQQDFFRGCAAPAPRSIAVVPWLIPLFIIEHHGWSQLMVNGGDKLMGDTAPSEQTAGFVRSHSCETHLQARVAKNLRHGNAKILPIERICEKGMPPERQRAIKAPMDRDHRRCS